MDSKKRTLVIAGVVIVVLLTIAAVVLVLGLTPSRNPFEKPYSVVYLRTGEVYIGKLSTFPRMKMTEGYLLRVVQDPKDPTKANFQLSPLTETLWSPQYLLLNRQQIVFYGPLKPDSQIARTLEKTVR